MLKNKVILKTLIEIHLALDFAVKVFKYFLSGDFYSVNKDKDLLARLIE